MNNDLTDLKAQLDLVSADHNVGFSEVGVPSLSGLIGPAQRRFTIWAKSGDRDTAALLTSFPPALFGLLDGVTIARSRRHVERHYAASMEHIGRFPKRSAQLSVFPSIDIEGSFPSFESVDDRINALELSLFRRPRKPLGGFAPLAEKTCHSASAPLIGRSARELRPLESGRPDPIREGRMCQKVR